MRLSPCTDRPDAGDEHRSVVGPRSDAVEVRLVTIAPVRIVMKTNIGLALLLASSVWGCVEDDNAQPSDDQFVDAVGKADGAYQLDGVVARDPFSAGRCTDSGYTPIAGSFIDVLQGKHIRYSLVVEKQTCSYADGCGDWKRQTDLLGAPLKGVAHTSPIATDSNYWLRFEGPRSTSSGRILRMDCLVQRAMKDDYHYEDFAAVRCGSPHVGTINASGTFQQIAQTDEDPTFNLIGNLTATCLDQTAPVYAPYYHGSQWNQWRAALMTHLE